jgi:hypothetical protein
MIEMRFKNQAHGLLFFVTMVIQTSVAYRGLGKEFQFQISGGVKDEDLPLIYNILSAILAFYRVLNDTRPPPSAGDEPRPDVSFSHEIQLEDGKLIGEAVWKKGDEHARFVFVNGMAFMYGYGVSDDFLEEINKETQRASGNR